MILPDGEKNAILKFHKSEKCRFNFREKFSNAIVEGGKNYRLTCINAIVRRFDDTSIGSEEAGQLIICDITKGAEHNLKSL